MKQINSNTNLVTYPTLLSMCDIILGKVIHHFFIRLTSSLQPHRQTSNHRKLAKNGEKKQNKSKLELGGKSRKHIREMEISNKRNEASVLSFVL